MSFVVYAAPYQPPAPPDAARSGLIHQWTGWDGSEWVLSDYRGGVFLSSGGVRGLSMPASDRHSSMSAGLPGSRHRGSRVREREVFWPLVTYTDAGSAGWIELERAFWRTMSADLPGVWSVTHPDGDSRSLRCRFVDDGDHSFERDPVRFGWSAYGVTLVADDPFWRGAPMVRTWGQSGGRSFWGEEGGPPFWVSSGSVFASASVENPGDEPARPVWLIHGLPSGGASSAAVGVDGRSVVAPFAIPEGSTLVLDSAPTALTATLVESPAVSVQEDEGRLMSWLESLPAGAGTDMTLHLGPETRWGTVPAGQSVPLTIDVVGSGSVQMILVPSYHRAW